MRKAGAIARVRRKSNGRVRVRRAHFWSRGLFEDGFLRAGPLGERVASNGVSGVRARGRLPPFFFYLAGYEYRFLCLYEVVAEECR